MVTLLKEISVHGFQIQLSIDKLLNTLFISLFVSKHITVLLEKNSEKKLAQYSTNKCSCYIFQRLEDVVKAYTLISIVRNPSFRETTCSKTSIKLNAKNDVLFSERTQAYSGKEH